MAEGRPEPLGVTPDACGVNVAVVAPDALGVAFCLFDASGTVELARHWLDARTGDVWHGHIAGVTAGARYGLRAAGPRDAMHRFNERKLLLDPWSRAIDRPFALHPSLWDNDDDSASHMPKAVVCDALSPPPSPPPRPGPRVIYEMHVRGFTMRHAAVPAALRGTFAGLAHPAAIAHLRALGVTHVELMPCVAGVDERHLPALGLRNYWNYNPIALLVPCPKLAPGGMPEVRAAVDALRAAGIGVILDVVLNHTGESDEHGPTLSLRGLANAAFHRLHPDGRYANDAGCGNTLALDRPWPLRLAMDALRHWAQHAGVDGFRLDLATTLARRDHGFDAQAPLLAAMRQDPVLRDRIIIAEPWDVGEAGYRFGKFPAGWGEWNDRFRDDVRRFWRGDAGMLGLLATRLAGSADVMRNRPLTDSINYVTAHDGFTLADLVSHAQRHNLANGEAGRDGTAENFSWNHGAEGASDDPALRAQRGADCRALLATLLLSRGTPMLAMGDEAGRTQGGNNNAYAQDNAISWFDWAAMDTALRDYTAQLVRLRLAHPTLTAARALTGDGDVAWQRLDGAPFREADWAQARDLAMLLTEADDRILLAINGNAEAAALTMPEARAGCFWRVAIDSAGQAEASMAPRSVRLLEEVPFPRAKVPSADPALLDELAAAAGIVPGWHDLAGREHRVPEATLRALLATLHLPAESQAQARDSLARHRAPQALPAQVTVQQGTPATLLLGPPLAQRSVIEAQLQGEDGASQILVIHAADGIWQWQDGSLYRRIALPLLPLGNYRLRAVDWCCRLSVVPASCFLPEPLGRWFGVAAQTYGLRRTDDQGIGDYTALGELACETAAKGARLLGLSPPHALSLLQRERASPYQPSDRQFLEPALVDVARLPFDVSEALALQQPIFAALRARDAVDYPAVWRAKQAVLRAAWQARPAHLPEFEAFRVHQGEALSAFATYNAIAEVQGHTDAQRWPAGLRHAEDHGVAGFAAAHVDAIGFHAFQQWLADTQLGAAATAGAGLYRDLAVGAAPDGAEVWRQPKGFLRGVSIGAPPDEFAPQGQNWGLPAPHPATIVGSFAPLLEANMRHAAALRIDHVMGLTRLFLVPEGAHGSEGAYLAYPRRDLLGQLALASQRARCLVVGEDLGTVPPGFREELTQAQLLSYRVLWFERQGEGFISPSAYPAQAAACVSTHDLPTLVGWWLGADIAEREALGLLDTDAARGARAARAREQQALLAALRAAGIATSSPEFGVAPDAEFVAAVHALVAATPSALLLVQAEDLAGERVAVNLPGTDQERPNWRRRLPMPVVALLTTPQAQATLNALRGRSTP